MRHVLPFLLAATLARGCAGSYDYGYGYTSDYSTPDLAYVGNGVYAVTDWDEPVFYADDYYWRYNSGLWYRSPFYYGDWQYHARPPRAVLQIDRPYNYVRYRPYPRGDYRYRSDYRAHDYSRHPDHRYRGSPGYRDHRTYRGQPGSRDHRGQPGSRDHRTYRDPGSVPRAQHSAPRAGPRPTPSQRPVMGSPAPRSQPHARPSGPSASPRGYGPSRSSGGSPSRGKAPPRGGGRR